MRFDEKGDLSPMTDHEVYKTGRRWFWWIIAASILVPAVSWGVWVATSSIRGSGDIVARENSADNRISAQAFFEDTYEAIQKFDKQIDDAQRAYDDYIATTPVPSNTDVVAVQLYTQRVNGYQTTIVGLQQQCRNSVAAYNAEARKTIRDDWRSEDLPYQIDELAAATDCLPAA